MTEVSIPIPARIGPYKVLRPLAQGGMAAVFEVQDPTTKEHVALKLLTHRGLAMPRFAREFRALTRLDHPNIVRVYRYGSHQGSPFLTMELLDGQSIQAYAKSVGRPGRPRRTREVLRITALVADALAYLHTRGIVHRDLKSANVMVLRDGRLKVLDFGTAHIATAGEVITRAGEFVGTFAYASPEQITGGAVDARSDLYSLGALLYRLCTGRRVFEADTPHGLARMHIDKVPRPPRELISALPQPVEDLILRMLAKDPADRPQSATEVANLIRGRARRPEDSGALTLNTPKLMGREQELEHASTWMEGACPGQALLVIGERGTGRQRTLNAIVAQARSRSWRVFDGAFTGQPGLGALGEQVESAWTTLPMQDRARLGDASHWLERASQGNLTEEDDFADVDNALLAILSARQKRDAAPLVLALSNLHRAPPVALRALSTLRARLREERVHVMFLGSCTDLSDVAGGTVRTRFPAAHRLSLGPLDANQVGLMVQQMLGGAVPPAQLTQTIHQATGGMPGFVEEVVRALVEQGSLKPFHTGGTLTWVDTSDGEIAIPRSAREAITFRLDGLGREEARVLETLGIAGGSTDITALAFALDLDPTALQATVDELTTQRILRCGEENGRETWSFQLSMTRELVLERVRPSRRNLLRRRLAKVMVNAPASAHKITLLAAAGHSDKALADTLLWAGPLIERGRAREALPVLEQIVGTADQAQQTSLADLARFWLLYGRAVRQLHPMDERVQKSFRQAAELTLDPEITAAADLYASKSLIERGLLEPGRARLLDAHNTLAGTNSPLLQARVARDLGNLQWFRGRFDEAENWFEAALSAARQVGEKEELASCLVARAVADLGAGNLHKAEQQLREAIHLYETSGDRYGLWQALGNLSEILRHRCAFSEAIGLLEPELKGAHASGDIERFAFLSVNLAEVEVELLRLGRARERLALVDGLLTEGRHLHLQAGVTSVRARIAMASNEPGQAERILEPMVRLCESSGLRVLTPLLQAQLGEALTITGDLARGRKLLNTAVADLSKERNMPLLAEACAARARARIGTPEESFAPVAQWLEDQPALLMKVTRMVARAEHFKRLDPELAHTHWTQVREALRHIRGTLAPADREAMRVHTWTVAVERALSQSV